jgi:hypothetical protein
MLSEVERRHHLIRASDEAGQEDEADPEPGELSCRDYGNGGSAPPSAKAGK